jgi:hypothetical protein
MMTSAASCNSLSLLILMMMMIDDDSDDDDSIDNNDYDGDLTGLIGHDS